MAKVKKIKVLHYAKFQAFLFALLGLLAGILYSFGGLFIDILVSADLLSSSAAQTPGLSHGTILAFGALLGMPLYFAAFGFISGMIGAIVFNATSKWFGGVEIDIT